MTKVRAYVPGDWTGLDEAVYTNAHLTGTGEDPLGPQVFEAHAVTSALRLALPDCDDEELEYVAMTAAAQDSVQWLRGETPSRRLVFAVDAEVVPVVGGEPSAVEVDVAIPGDVVAFHVDDADAASTVRAAWVAVVTGEGDEAALLERCADHELLWFAASELDQVMRILAEHKL